MMRLDQAVMLVNEKYLEETSGVSAGAIAERYKQACEESPALMTLAHAILAHRLAKNLP
jgi:hypothetical protein